jgi:SAM-dependent methyltransferase
MAGQDRIDPSTVELFQDSWKRYRVMVDNNYLFHREAYGGLRRVLDKDYPRPFRFLDIACGDASAAAIALRGTSIAHYRGVDFSAAALTLAAVNLRVLGCPVDLTECDFLDIESYAAAPLDIVWIGLSLHHLLLPAKLDFMRKVRSRLLPGGSLIVFEDTSPDGEDRAGWMRRWDLQRPLWTAYSDSDWEAVSAHVHAADFPETDSTWRQLGRDAGFGAVSEVERVPFDLFRVYRFSV